jgi:hypothetical protein
MANRESGSSWKDFLLGLRRRGLNGVEFIVADDHELLGRLARVPAALRELPGVREIVAFAQQNAPLRVTHDGGHVWAVNVEIVGFRHRRVEAKCPDR